MTIDEQKDVADKVLKRLFPIDPFSIVAGGAPRDWYFGNLATDIDVFLHTSVPQIGIIEDMIKSVGIEIGEAKVADGLPEWYKLNEYLRCVFDTVVDGVPVQIMVMTEPTFKSVVPQFPFSVCKAWYKNRDGWLGQQPGSKSGVGVHREFLAAEKHKIIVKTNTVYSDEHKYVQKIRSKFPEHTYFESWDIAKDYVFYKVQQ